MAAILALVSAVTFGVADFAGGVATRKVNVFTVTLISNVVGAVLAVVLALIFGGHVTAGAVVWGALAGLCGVTGLVMLFAGLAIGPARLVSPLSGVLSAVIPVVVGVVGGERPGTLATIGLLLAPPSIWLVAGGGAGVRPERKPLLLAIGAGIGFGLFFVLLTRAPTDAGAVPLLAARVSATALMIGIAVVKGVDRSVIERPNLLLIPIVSGAIDISSNGLFLWASRLGDLSVVAALTSLYPVSTVLLALVVFGERMSRSQMFGLALAVTSAALLS